ncbi:MAG TPA: ribonuclease E/G [Methylomirabilota bacterium]|nr:ribonuclease E/G [Methylomirabilota bacterium]
MKDGRVVEFHPDLKRCGIGVGDIYIGRIVAVDRRVNAAFVDIGETESGFLPLSETAEPPVEGASMLVQVEREPRRGKGPRLSGRPTLMGARLIFSPTRPGVTTSSRITDAAERRRLDDLINGISEKGEGWIVRTAAVHAEPEILRSEVGRLRAAWRDMSARKQARASPSCVHRELAIDRRLLRDHAARFVEVIFDRRGPAEAARDWCEDMRLEAATRIVSRPPSDWALSPVDILGQIDDALDAAVELPSGGIVRFDPTPTLTAVDVDSGRATGFAADLGAEKVFLQTNLEAADVIANQLRVRNIGGIVVIDFIDLKDPASRRRIVDRLRAAVAADSAPCWVGEMSRLGLVEMTRRRRGRPLEALLTKACGTCDGTGRVRHARDDVED